MNILKQIFLHLLSFLSKPLFLGNISFKLNKKNWYFKKGDQDINPSFPHLHCRDSKLKMNIYTGDIYDGKTAILTLNNEDYHKLWSDKNFRSQVEEIRKTYPYGEEKLPPIPSVDNLNNICRNSSSE